MKDLKHLLYFENLLQEAQNELILQAQSDGKVCVAYVCENTPEPLLNLPGAFSTRLRAPRTGSMEMATYYMTSFLCEYSRALLERAIEGGYNFADCLITPDGCTMMNRAVENMELLKALGKGKEKFFFEYMEIPMKADDNGLISTLSSARITSSSPCMSTTASTSPTRRYVRPSRSTTASASLSAPSANTARVTSRVSPATSSTSSRWRPTLPPSTCLSTSSKRRWKSSRPASRTKRATAPACW